jgi:hypothetical protein
VSDVQDGLTRLRDLIAEDPAALSSAAGATDVKAASAALSRYAASTGISVSPDAVEGAFQRKDAPGRPELLDDQALDTVAGGGSGGGEGALCLLSAGNFAVYVTVI